MSVNPILEARALAHQEGASTQELAPPTRVEIGNPNRGEEVDAQQCGQFTRVDGIGLGACLPDELDMERVRDPHRVPMLGKPRRQPFPVTAIRS